MFFLFYTVQSRIIGSIPDDALEHLWGDADSTRLSDFSGNNSIIFCEKSLTYDIPENMDFKCSLSSKYPKYYLYQHKSIRNDAISFDKNLYLSSTLALLLRSKFSSINMYLAHSTYILSSEEKTFENYTSVTIENSPLAFLESSSYKIHVYSNLSSSDISLICHKSNSVPKIGIFVVIILIVLILINKFVSKPEIEQTAKFWVFDQQNKVIFGGDFSKLDNFTKGCIMDANNRARKSNQVVTQIIKINRHEVNHHFVHIGAFPVNNLLVSALWMETFDDESKTNFDCTFSSATHGLLKPPKITFSSYRDYRPIHVTFTLDNNVRCVADLPAAAFSPFQPYGQLVCLVLSMYYELMSRMKESKDGILDLKLYVEKCFTRFKAKRITIFNDNVPVINLTSDDAVEVSNEKLLSFIEPLGDHDFTYIHGAITPDRRLFACKQKGFSSTFSFVIEVPESHPIDVYDDYAFPFFAICTIFISQSNFSAKQLSTFNNFFNAILENENLNYVEFLLNKDIILSHSNPNMQKFTHMKDLLTFLNEHQYPHILECFNELINEDIQKQKLVRKIYKRGDPSNWYILSAASTFDSVQEDFVVTIFIEKMTQEKRQEHEMFTSFKTIEQDFINSKVYKLHVVNGKVYVVGRAFLELIIPEGKIDVDENEEIDLEKYVSASELPKLAKIANSERVTINIRDHSFISTSNDGIGFLICSDAFPDVASNQPEELPFPSATSSVVFWIVDTQTEKVSSIFMQPTILDVIGVSHDTKFSSLSTSIHPDDRDSFIKGYNELLNRRTNQFSGELRIMRAGGDYEWHRLALALSGTTLHCLAMNTNKQREVEFKLRETRQLRDLLLSSGKLSLWTFKDNNEPAEKMVGFLPGVVRGVEMNWTFIKQNVPEEYRQSITTEIEKALDTATTIEIDFPIDLGNQNLIWVSVRGKGDTSLRQVVGVCIDVTELRNAYNRLETERARAEEANKQKTLFLANMSHEIRTPMNGIFGMLDVLSLQELTSEQRLLVDSIRSSSFQLMKLLDDTLHLSKIEQGETEVEMVHVDIWQLIAPTVLANYTSAKENGVKLALSVSTPFPSLVKADPQLIMKIFNNLLSNAIKFTKQGRIDIKLSFENETFKLSVADTGIGISKDQRAVIFERFAQADDCVARFFGGTGLGLSLVQEIAKFLGGDVNVESEVGKGSTFTVTIPMESILYPYAPTPKNKRSVLLYCEDEDTSKMLKDWLKILKYEYIELDNPDNFIEKMRPDTVAYFLETSHPMKQIKDKVARAGKIVVCAIADPGDTCIFRNSISRPIMFHHVQKFLDDIKKGVETSIIAAPIEQTTPLRILVVEDNKANQFVMKKILQNLQCTFQIAENGSEAITALDNAEFDIVFMDCQMPVLDGLEATRRIRASGKQYSNVPIVALTASAVEGDEQVCMDAGMDAYLAKPVRMQQIMALIKRFSQH